MKTCEITPSMIAAGEAVLVALEGEASKAFLAKVVFLAMQLACPAGAASKR
jgi:hypothetical protein